MNAFTRIALGMLIVGCVVRLAIADDMRFPRAYPSGTASTAPSTLTEFAWQTRTPLTQTDTGGNYTVGVLFAPMSSSTITGANVRASANTIGKTIKVSLWNAGGTRVASGTGTLAAGLNAVSFSTPYALTTSDIGTLMCISTWITDGSYYIYTNTEPTFVPTGRRYGAGDAYPASTSAFERYWAAEPVGTHP